MKKARHLISFLVMAGLLFLGGCTEEFLQITPNGVLDEAVLATYEGVDALLIGAYSMLDGVAEGISRCNQTISAARAAIKAQTITLEEYDSFVRQARVLRGFYHFEAWRLWADPVTFIYVPFVDENTDLTTLTNTEDIRALIIEDLTEVAENGTNPVGQKASLELRYGDIFDIENRNGVESIYTVQYSVNDGSGGWNAGWGEVLNFPYKTGESPGGCCSFFQPTQDFVNSFGTDNAGLPYLDDYNNEKITNDQGLAPGDPFTEYSGQVDPRLDWSVGRRGIPYWDWGEHTGSDWIRDQSYAGPYSPKKQVYKKSQEGTYTDAGNWTSGYTANGYRMIRYADVLLLKAECEAMTSTDDLGLGEVNAIRSRAANPEGFVMEEDGVTPAANYEIGLYADFPDHVFALKAIKFERKLELGQEGHRYYDLQRWGDVESELNRILNYERTTEWGTFHYGNAFVGPEDVNFPIPQRQIDLSQGMFQNR